MKRLLALALAAGLALGCATKLYAVGESHTLMGDEIVYSVDEAGAFEVACSGNCRELSGGHGSAGFYGWLTGLVSSARSAALMAVGVPPVSP